MTMEKDCITNGEDILKALSKPMEDNEIEWKVQTVVRANNGELKALIVPYVQARAIQNRLDQVCGLGWKSTFKIINLDKILAVECTISIYYNGQWISRSDAAELTNIEAIKGGYSDAMKRAAVQFGIGRFLYSLPQQWVPILQNRPQQPHEYVNSRYKIGNQPEIVKGYFIRPSVKNLIANLNQQQSPQIQQKPQSKGQPPQQRGNQPSQRHMNHDDPTEYEMENVRNYIIDCLQRLNIAPEYLPNLFQKVNVQGYSSIQQASFEELQRLHNMLGPVKMYMEIGKKNFGLNEEQLFAYASAYLKQPIGKVSQLFNRLNTEAVTAIFDHIKSQNKQQKIG